MTYPPCAKCGAEQVEVSAEKVARESSELAKWMALGAVVIECPNGHGAMLAPTEEEGE